MLHSDRVRAHIPLPNILPTDGDPCFSPRTNRRVEASKGTALFEEVQRSHFRAFFAEQHQIRRPLLPDANLPAMMRILVDGLRRMASSAPWFRLQLHLKVRNTLRKRAHRALQMRAERAETLDGWLQFWCAAEARIQQNFRQQLVSPVTMQEVLRWQPGTIARAITPVADALKVQVIWELYWILRMQYTHRLKTHVWRLLSLLAQRQAFKLQRSPKVSASATVDFWQGEAVSLRAINAAIFVQSLQEPKFQYAVGRDIKVTELLRL
eukprot:EG_transcript_23956